MQAERVPIEEAELITGLRRRTLQDLSARGEIWGAAKLGRRWTYDRLRLRAWIKANESAVERRKISTSATAFSMPALPSQGENIDDRLKRVMSARLSGGSLHG